MRFLSIIALMNFIDNMEWGGFTSSVSKESIKETFRKIGVPISNYDVTTNVFKGELCLVFKCERLKEQGENVYIPLIINFIYENER